jgi:tRNA pseudouridine38-40 synthase
MPTYKITLAYDGSQYVGWQRQAAGPSIQGAVEDALRALDGAVVAVAGAGRTDAGVHALGQVASFALARDMAPEILQRALNGRLPRDIRVVVAERASARFHARFSARRKIYRYRIGNAALHGPFEQHYTWHVPAALDVEAMDAAARQLEGKHDFAAFQTTGGATRTTVRTMFRSRVARVEPSAGLPGHELCGAELVVHEIAGDGFLRHMVRAVAGTLVEIGRGRWPPDRMRDILAARDRSLAGPTAPAEGLFLVGVEYGDL